MNMLKFRIMNMETGVVCDCDKLKPLIGFVKEWASAGTKPSDIQGVCNDKRVEDYIKQVANMWYGINCPDCNHWVRTKDMHSLDDIFDSDGELIVLGCINCL